MVKKQIFFRVISVVYLMILVYAVFFARRRRGNIDFRHYANGKPVAKLYAFFKTHGLDFSKQHYFFWENFLGNIIMFIPLPLAIVILCQKNIASYKLFSYVTLVSVSIEMLQYSFNIGYTDVDDVLLNTLGGLIGIALTPLFSGYISLFKRP